MIELAEWDATMRVNVTGMFLMCRAAVGPMGERETASIVNISSLAAVYGLPNALHYTTSKAAVLGNTRGLARELARWWIRVNAVAPGIIRTPMHDGGNEEFLAGLHPMNRIGSIQDIVDATLYLEDASFVTGEILHVDGGQIAGQ